MTDARTLPQLIADAGWIGIPLRLPDQAPLPVARMDYFRETYAAVTDGSAVPVEVQYLEPGMRVVAAVRLADRTVLSATTHKPRKSRPGTWYTRVSWQPEHRRDSIASDVRTFRPDDHAVVEIASLPWE